MPACPTCFVSGPPISIIYAVRRIERVEGITSLPTPPHDVQPPSLFIEPDLHALWVIAERVDRTECLGEFLETALHCLDELFGLHLTMLLLLDEKRRTLQTIASRGDQENGLGSEAGFGEGLIGTVAAAQLPLRLSGLDHTLRYARAVHDRAEALSGPDAVCREIPLPGLSNASTQIAVPLMIQNRCLGVSVAETLEPLSLLIREETLMAIVAGHLAAGIEQSAQETEDQVPFDGPLPTPPVVRSISSQRSFCFDHADDCIFADGKYLIKNVPGRMLWGILKQHQDEQRVEFTNRELRMDSWLGLPEWKDNFETRLILLRKRLEQKCPDVRLVPRRRGRFALEPSVKIALSETPA